MTSELNNGEGRPDDAERDVTQGISLAGADEPLDIVQPEEKKSVLDSLRDAYLRARDGRTRNPAKQARAAKTVDRSKGLLVLAVAVVVMLFVFLGMFSTSSVTKHREAKQDQAESRQTRDAGDRRGPKPRLGDAIANCGYERWEGV
jgi:hypothetical protein